MSDFQVSEERLSQLAGQAAKKAMEAYRFQGGKISGENILNFHPHRQVNLFIMFQLYQDLSYQLGLVVKSGFDFDNEEVRESLRKFQSALSRHILVSQDEFRPRVEKAVYNSMKLILRPDELLQNFFFSGAPSIPVELFQRNSAYFSDFDFIIGSLAKYFEKNNVKIVERSEFSRLFLKVVDIFEKKENKPFSEHCARMMEKAFALNLKEFEAPILPDPEIERQAAKRNIAETYSRAQKVDIYSLPSSEEPAQKEQPKVQPPPQNVVKPVMEEIKPSVLEPQVEEPVAENIHTKPIDLFGGAFTRAIPPTDEEKKEPQFLHQKFREENRTPSLNENIRVTEIPVHKQFQIIQKVFRGNNIKFKAVMDKLNEAATLHEAEDILEKYVFNSPEVDPSDPVAQEFGELVKARF